MGTRLSMTFKALLAATCCGLVATSSASALTSSQKTAIQKVGSDAYIYGYAPVYMQRNVARFPADRVVNVQYLATELTRTVVKPNSDTLYSIIILDVGTDPVILHAPSTGSRYFSFELLDGHTNVFGYIGTRATGTTGGDYAIVGPNWNSTTTPLAKTVTKVIRSRTPRVWVVGRTLVDGEADLPAAVAVQNQITAQKNSKVGDGTYLPNFNLKTPSNALGTPADMVPNAAYFKEFGTVMAAQPPAPADSKLVTALAKYGVGPARDPNKTQSSAVMAELVKGAKAGQAKIDAGIEAQRKASANKNNGWILFDRVGDFGTDYLTRAIIAQIGVGANKPEESIYPGTSHDYTGKVLSGAGGKLYKVHFNPGQEPPVDGFWSISMYAEDQFFIANPINRFQIGDRTPNMVRNSDGSLDIWVSKAQPSAARGGVKNWLPAPAANFTLVMRAYIPRPSILNGTWKYPKITRVS